MPATLNGANKGQNNGSGTNLQLDAGIAGSSGDIMIAVAKHEGAADSGVLRVDDAPGGTPMTAAIAYASHANNDLHGRVFYTVLGSSGTFNPEMVCSARSFRSLLAWTFTPTVGYTWGLGNTGLGSATDTTPTTTSATSDGTGVAISGLPIYGDRTYTPDSPFTEAANHSGTYLVRGSYAIAPTAGGLVASGTWSATVEWVNMLVLFTETLIGPPPPPPRIIFPMQSVRF
jgi:hypothetical protein